MPSLIMAREPATLLLWLCDAQRIRPCVTMSNRQICIAVAQLTCPVVSGVTGVQPLAAGNSGAAAFLDATTHSTRQTAGSTD